VLTAYVDRVVNSEAVQEASLLTTLPTYAIPRCLHCDLFCWDVNLSVVGGIIMLDFVDTSPERYF
jgi:hypothetical protein